MRWTQPWRRVFGLLRQQGQGSAGRRFCHPRLEWLERRLAPAAHDTLGTAFVNATPLNSSGQVQGTLTGGQPQDYRVTVSGDTFLLATAVPLASPGFEPRVTLYDGTGQLLIQSDQQKPGLAAATVEQHLQPGTYYLEVSAAASSSTAASSQAYQLTSVLDASLPPFAPLPVGRSPRSIAVADLGNGRPDLVVANEGDNTVSVLLGNGDGTFQPAQTFAVGSGPLAVAVADLGNGHPDLVTANSGANTVSVLLGQGDGTFQPAQSLAVGSEPYAVAVADLGNGRADIITANFGANTVSVLLGNGDGTFHYLNNDPAQGTFAVGTNPYAVAVADLGNGHPDLVTANEGAGTVSVLLGNGDGTFHYLNNHPVQGTFTVGSGSAPFSVAVADLGNGHPDLVTANYGANTVSVLLGQGDGTFQPAQSFAVGTNPAAVAVADLGNGHPDLVTANYGANTVSVLLGNGDGTFQPAQSLAVGSEPQAVAVANLGNDRPDIVTANFVADTVSVLLGNGDGTFQPAQSLAVGSEPQAVAVADLGNGHPDLVTANYGANTVSVLLSNGDGTFQPALSFEVGSEPEAVAVADLGNGHPDLVTANTGAKTVSVLLGNGDGTFQPALSFAVGSEPQAVVVADLGNGHPDLVTANTGANTVSVLLGNGDGTFQPALSFAVGNNPYAVAVADLGNGHPDLVTANFADNTVSVLLGNGDGTFQPAQSFAVGSGPLAVAVADLGNGHPDLVTANYGANTVSVLLGNGVGTFQPAQSFEVGSEPYSVAVADLGNGRADLVTANHSANTVSVLLGQGDGTFQPAQSLAVGSGPKAVAVADLGNGRADLVTANFVDNTVSVLLGNGDGTFQPAQSFEVGSGPYSMAAADLGNGQADLVTANYVTGMVSVLLGNGDGTFHYLNNDPAQDTFAVGRGPVSVAVMDVNGDGRPDIVTANQVDNTVSVLLGNGDGTFQPAHSFVVGRGPHSVAVMDVNGDGQADLVTANSGADTVSVLLGNGDGTFQDRVDYAVGSEPESVAVADLGNGHLDLITANTAEDTVSVLLGNGDGTFQLAQSLAVGSVPVSVAVADLGNGHPDLITANYGANTVSVLLGNGDGTFQPARSLAVGSYPNSVVVAAVRGNNPAYIVTANYGANTVSVLLRNGDGTFQPAQSLAVANEPESVALADVNNDGRADIVTANAGINGALSVLLNQGSVQFQAPTGPSGIPSRDVPQLQDLTGDGIPDAVSLNQKTGQILFRAGTNDPRNPFAPFIVVNPDHRASDFTLVQTAGLPEIAVLDASANTVFLYAWSQRQSTFVPAGSILTGSGPVRLASSDLNGDGLGDLVIGNDFDHTVTIAFQLPSGQFDPNSLTRSVGAGPSSITFADLNGDHLLDIVVSDQVSGDVSVLLNDSTPTSQPTFTTQARYRAGQEPSDVNPGTNGTTLLTQLQTVGVVAGTFTGTGRTELVALNANIHSFSLLRAAGGGSLIDPQVADSYLVGPGALQALAGDFLDDGRQDLAVLVTAADGTSQILVYPGKGDGTFARTPVVSVAGQGATGFSFVPGTAGQPDRLVVGNSYGDFLILQGDGAGHFVVDRSGLNGQPLAVLQRKDAPPLVVLGDEQTGQVRVFVQSGRNPSGASPFTALGAVSVPTSSLTQVAPAPGSVLLTDLNGDGIPDLVVADRLGNDVLVFPGKADGTFSATPYPIAVGFEPDAIAVGDFHSQSDGIPDLAVANQGSNDVSILNGAINAAGQWTATPGPRLSSGGSEPLAIAAGTFTGRPGILDLRVTNAGGQITTLPGIGSAAQTPGGTGFFRDATAVPADLGAPVVQAVVDPGTGAEFLLRADGGVSAFNGSGFTTLVGAGGDIATLGVADGFLAVGFDDGSVGLLSENSGALMELHAGDFADQPSALEALQNGDEIDVYLAYQGRDVPVFYSFPIPVVEVPLVPQGAEATGLPEANLLVVALVLNSGLADHPLSEPPLATPPEGTFVLFLPEAGAAGPAAAAEPAAAEVVDGEAREQVAAVPEPPAGEGTEHGASLEAFHLRVDEALRQWQEVQQAQGWLEDLLDGLDRALEPWRDKPQPGLIAPQEQQPSMRATPTDKPGATAAEPAPSPGPETIPLWTTNATDPDAPAAGSTAAAPDPSAGDETALDLPGRAAAPEPGQTGSGTLTALVAAGLCQAAWSAGPGPAQPLRSEENSARRRAPDRER